MREAEEAAVWGKLLAARVAVAPNLFEVGNGTTIDLSSPCTVLGGRNGAGKSRLLRRLEEHLGEKALFVDLHHLVEQALIVLRSRTDFEAMTEEVDPLGPDGDRLKDVQKVVGRAYDEVAWFALEVEPDDEQVAQRFRWTGDQPLIPYFRARYRGHSYSSKEMGLGEFSVHFLFWILDHFREEAGIVLLLDEPDAYLPPVGVRSLLIRVLNLCLRRNWSAVISTHSEEMISLALEHDSFTLLEVDAGGETAALHATDDPMAAISLLTRPPIEGVAFVEDEAACSFARGLLSAVDPMLARRTAFLWGGRGHGYLRQLHEHLPKPPKPEVRFTYIFDGDQRGTVDPTLEGRWQEVFLPTTFDPDTLMKELAPEVSLLAGKLMTSETRMRAFLASVEGDDPHDWVIKLGEEFGRPLVLQALSASWAELNQEEAEAFVSDLKSAWS